MLKDVLVVWSVGPVPTKHLIGLIKKNLGMILFERWGVRPRARSVLTSSLPHTSRHCHQLQQHDAKNTREREREWKQILGKSSTHCLVILQKKKKRGRKPNLKHGWSLLSKMHLLSVSTDSPVCPHSLKSTFKLSAAECPECKSESSSATSRTKPVFWSNTVHMNQTYACGKTART